MSKHLGLLTKVDNTGTKWYRRILNVGDTKISAGNFVEIAYDSHSTNALTLTGNANISCDYNLGRLISGGATCYGQPTGKVLGVACQGIPQRGATVGDERYYDGWVQYKGAAMVSTRCVVTANTVVAIASSTAGHGKGHGACMMTADDTMAGSGGIGYCLSTNGAGNGPGGTWVYLWLD